MGRDQLGRATQLADRAMDRHRADAALQFDDVMLDILGRYLGRRLCIRIKPTGSVQKMQEVAVPSCKVILRDGLEMAGGSPTFETRRWPACGLPCLPVGGGPPSDGQITDAG